MNYYIQGDITHCSAFKNMFAELGFKTNGCEFADYDCLYFTTNGKVCSISASGPIANIIKTHPDYKELELPIEPKFKVGDKVLDDMMIVTVREVVYDQNYKEYKYGIGSYWVFESALKPYKPHYDIANFKPFDKVLIRVGNKSKWTCDFFSYYYKGFHCIGTDDWSQCIPFEGNEHLLGTTDMPSEEFINW